MCVSCQSIIKGEKDVGQKKETGTTRSRRAPSKAEVELASRLCRRVMPRRPLHHALPSQEYHIQILINVWFSFEILCGHYPEGQREKVRTSRGEGGTSCALGSGEVEAALEAQTRPRRAQRWLSQAITRLIELRGRMIYINERPRLPVDCRVYGSRMHQRKYRHSRRLLAEGFVFCECMRRRARPISTTDSLVDGNT